jgi:nucleoside-diphosphate kinase
MALERTFSILKPDATARNLTGAINAMIEQAGLRIVAQKRLRISLPQARKFYAVHRERPFFSSLVTFMTSGPCMPLVLEKADAVAALRKAIGATDPKEAEQGTVRQLFAESKERNAIHASDSDENAARESCFFFSNAELLAAR